MERHGISYAAELPFKNGGSCLLLGERRSESSAAALVARRSERNPFTGHIGGTTTPPYVFRVPRMLFQEMRPQKSLRRNDFLILLSWNRVLNFLTLFQENEGVCSKKKGHEKATQPGGRSGFFMRP